MADLLIAAKMDPVEPSSIEASRVHLADLPGPNMLMSTNSIFDRITGFVKRPTGLTARVAAGLLSVALLTARPDCAWPRMPDRVPNAIKTLAIAAYTRRYCRSLAVDPIVERDWLLFDGYDPDRRPLSEDELRAVELQVHAYLQDSTMTCAAVYLGYGPMGTVVNGMVDRANFFQGMIELF